MYCFSHLLRCKRSLVEIPFARTLPEAGEGECSEDVTCFCGGNCKGWRVEEGGVFFVALLVGGHLVSIFCTEGVIPTFERCSGGCGTNLSVG